MPCTYKRCLSLQGKLRVWQSKTCTDGRTAESAIAHQCKRHMVITSMIKEVTIKNCAAIVVVRQHAHADGMCACCTAKTVEQCVRSSMLPCWSLRSQTWFRGHNRKTIKGAWGTAAANRQLSLIRFCEQC